MQRQNGTERFEEPQTPITFWTSLEMRKKLKTLAAVEGTAQRLLLEEAMADLFAKRERSQSATR